VSGSCFLLSMSPRRGSQHLKKNARSVLRSEARKVRPSGDGAVVMVVLDVCADESCVFCDLEALAAGAQPHGVGTRRREASSPNGV
jgi:hypothetical protein